MSMVLKAVEVTENNVGVRSEEVWLTGTGTVGMAGI